MLGVSSETCRSVSLREMTIIPRRCTPHGVISEVESAWEFSRSTLMIMGNTMKEAERVRLHLPSSLAPAQSSSTHNIERWQPGRDSSREQARQREDPAVRGGDHPSCLQQEATGIAQGDGGDLAEQSVLGERLSDIDERGFDLAAPDALDLQIETLVDRSRFEVSTQPGNGPTEPYERDLEFPPEVDDFVHRHRGEARQVAHERRRRSDLVRSRQRAAFAVERGFERSNETG